MRYSWVAVAAIASFSLFGCSRRSHSGGEEATPAQARCKTTPAQGSRFSLCGTLSTSNFGGTTESGRELLGSLEAAPRLEGKKFVVQRSTFNAFR